MALLPSDQEHTGPAYLKRCCPWQLSLEVVGLLTMRAKSSSALTCARSQLACIVPDSGGLLRGHQRRCKTLALFCLLSFFFSLRELGFGSVNSCFSRLCEACVALSVHCMRRFICAWKMDLTIESIDKDFIWATIWVLYKQIYPSLQSQAANFVCFLGELTSNTGWNERLRQSSGLCNSELFLVFCCSDT